MLPNVPSSARVCVILFSTSLKSQLAGDKAPLLYQSLTVCSFLQVFTVTVCVMKDAGDPTAPTAAPVRTGAPAPQRTAPVCALPATAAPTADEVKEQILLHISALSTVLAVLMAPPVAAVRWAGHMVQTEISQQLTDGLMSGIVIQIFIVPRPSDSGADCPSSPSPHVPLWYLWWRLRVPLQIKCGFFLLCSWVLRLSFI